MGGAEALAGEGRVGGDDAVDAAVSGDGGDIRDLRFLKIGGDLEEEGRPLPRHSELVTLLHRAGQERLQRGGALQVAQFFGVGGGDVERHGADKAVEALHDLHIVGDPVLAVLVGAKIGPDPRRAAPPRVQAAGDHVEAVIVEAEAVDRRPVLRQPEEAGAGVAGLGAGGNRADFDEAEAEGEHGVRRLGVLVETCGDADGRGQVEAEKAGGEDRVRVRRLWQEAELQPPDRGAVGGFGVEKAKGAEAVLLKEGHAISGKIWPPLASSGRDFAQATSARRRRA